MQKNQPIYPALKNQVFEFAHDHYLSMSQVVNTALEHIAGGVSQPPVIASKETLVPLKYTADPAIHARAQEAADRAGVPLSRWVSAELERMVAAK